MNEVVVVLNHQGEMKKRKGIREGDCEQQTKAKKNTEGRASRRREHVTRKRGRGMEKDGL